jgi:hypothetical protein
MPTKKAGTKAVKPTQPVADKRPPFLQGFNQLLGEFPSGKNGTTVYTVRAGKDAREQPAVHVEKKSYDKTKGQWIFLKGMIVPESVWLGMAQATVKKLPAK